MTQQLEEHLRRERMNALLDLARHSGWKEHLLPEVNQRIEAHRTALEGDKTEKETTAIRGAIKELRWLLTDLLNVESLKANLAADKPA